jgi:hypothetical protein
MKKMYLLVLSLLAAGSAVWAMPSSITYQGTLKDKGNPAQGPYPMTFQLTDKTGNNPYSNVISSQVTVTNGLFSAQLNFQLLGTYTWDAISPYLQVTVNGQILSPTEPVNATAYALVSNTVVNGAIDPTKVASGYGLIPSGMIAMFATTCPSGWSVFTGLQGKFPVGADPTNPTQFTMGQTGGNLNHVHSISADGTHTHTTAPLTLNTATTANSGTVYMTLNAPNWVPWYPGQTTSSSGNHDHGGQTGQSSTLPPYMAMVFCQKI